jgi:hypothetical protein
VTWFWLVIPALKRQGKEDGEFKASLYYIENPVLKKEKKEMIKDLSLLIPF